MSKIKKLFSLLVLTLLPLIFTCSNYPILSDFVNNRITLILKGTYESNDAYGWNANTYGDDSFTAGGYALASTESMSNVSMYLDIADIRLAVGSGKPANTPPTNYWTYFTKQREVFCSSNTSPYGYNLLTCVKDHGAQNYTDFFTTGFNYPAVDIPVVPIDLTTGKQKTDSSGKPATVYNDMAIFFRRMVIGPAYQYDASNANPVTQTILFDNRVVNGLDLMSDILQYASSDTSKSKTLMFPLERTDLSIKIPDGNGPYVMEVRIFLKNLLMKHVIKYGKGAGTAQPLTFIGPSDWKYNHDYADPTLAFQMGGNMIFTARVYDPATVGSIDIVDASGGGAVSPGDYFVAVPAGTAFDVTVDMPYAATSRQNGTASIKNLPPGSYDIYKVCDKQYQTAGGLNNASTDGFPDTSDKLNTPVTVTADGTVTVPSPSTFATTLCPAQ